nr:uncharacterized protein LOC123747175 [Procambarus clarkii]XP_045585171.1 uncharacterized protein LOC123747175 [Procambarus clarkii]
MFVLMEQRDTQFMGKDEKSGSCKDACNVEGKEMCCSVSDNDSCCVEHKKDISLRKDKDCNEADNDILGYRVVENHASDSCLTVRIAVKKGSSTIIPEDQKPFNDITHVDDKESDRLTKYGIIPGLWKPSKRRKRNLYAEKRKKSWRLECMVPGCCTRAYTSRFVKFPDELEWRIKWASKSKLNEKFPDVDPREVLPKRIGICMAHFRDDDFHVICRGDGKVCRLKKGVEPSIFPWVEVPSDVTSAMKLFENTKFSREMRLLNLMKNELHNMMNPPTRYCSIIPEHTFNLNENNTLKTDVHSIDYRNLPNGSKTVEASNYEQSYLSECNGVLSEASDIGQNNQKFWSSPRSKFRDPINYDESILREEIEDLEDNESTSYYFYSARKKRAREKIYSEPNIISERSNNILKDSSKIDENKKIPYELPNHRIKTDISESSNAREGCEIVHYPSDQGETEDMFVNLQEDKVRFPRKCKLNSGLCTPLEGHEIVHYPSDQGNTEDMLEDLQNKVRLPRKCKLNSGLCKPNSGLCTIPLEGREILHYPSDQKNTEDILEDLQDNKVRLPRKCKLNSGLCTPLQGHEIVHHPSDQGNTEDMLEDLQESKVRFPRKCKSNSGLCKSNSGLFTTPLEGREIFHYPSDQKNAEDLKESSVRFPRKSKLNSGLCTPFIAEKNNGRMSQNKKCTKKTKHYDKKKKRKKPVNLSCNEEYVYDVKIENCEVEMPEGDCNIKVSDGIFSENQEEMCEEFNHFLAPISNAFSNEHPCEDVPGSLNAQMIASCIEVALSPVIAKLELFQGKVESSIEQLEGRVNSRLENLEGRVSLCLEKLENLNSSDRAKASNISSGIWFNRCEHIAENSTLLTPSNGMATPGHYTDVSLKPFAISEKEYEMMEG